MDKFYASLDRLEAAGDSDLAKYCIETETLRELSRLASGRVLAVGLKGVGKTAAFRYLTEFKPAADVIVPISPTTHQLLLPRTDIHYSACRQQFEHDLVVESLRAIYEARKRLSARLSKAHLDKAGRQFESYRQKVQAAAGRLRGISILGCGLTISDPTSRTLVGLRPISEIEESKSLLRTICNSGIKVRIVVDDPEMVFSASQELDIHLVGGFFLAALSLSREISQLKVNVLVKTHVYEPVETMIEDFDHFPEPAVRLSWDLPELVELVAKRVRWAGGKWNDYFALSEAELTEVVSLRLRNGPRDLLYWIGLASKSRNPLSASDLEKFRLEASKFSLLGLARSYSSTYPKIRDVIELIFRDKAGERFTLEALREYLETLLTTDTAARLSSLAWVQEQTHYSLPELLFRIGALALRFEDGLILPYENRYDQEHFEKARSLELAPALREAIGA